MKRYLITVGLFTCVLTLLLVRIGTRSCNDPYRQISFADISELNTLDNTYIALTGFIKRTRRATHIYESFHRAWWDGGEIYVGDNKGERNARISDELEKSASRFSLVFDGLPAYAFSETSPPIFATCKGQYKNTRPVDDKNILGLIEVKEVIFLEAEKGLQKVFLVPEE